MSVLVLDLRKDSTLSSEDCKYINETDAVNRQRYTKAIEKMIAVNQLSGLSLLVGVTCRNPFLSEVLNSMSLLSLLRFRLSQGKKYTAIKISNVHLVAPVRDLLDFFCSEECVIDLERARSWRAAKLSYNLVRSVYGCTVDIFWSRFYRLKKRPQGSILFIDTFLMRDSIGDDGKYVDRYYTGHEDYLTECEKNKRWFAPTLIDIVDIVDYKNLFSKISEADVNFFVQEAWLTVGDYLTCLYQSLVLPFRIKCVPKFDGFDLRELIQSEAFLQIGSFALVKTLAKYRFIRRLAKEGVEICGAIDWQENQVVDRALNLAFKRYYPKVCVHGYQGFMVSDYYACAQPAEFERELGTLPDIFHVLGPNAHALRDDATRNIVIYQAPAFRFSYLHKLAREPWSNFTVLVTLPIIVKECLRLVEASLALKHHFGEDVTLIVKLHPSYSVDRFLELAPKAELLRSQFTDFSMEKLLQISTMMLSSASTSAVEAVAIGVPVAIVGSLNGVTMNPIPESAPKELHCIVYSNDELIIYIDQLLQQETHKSIVEQFFNPLDRDGARSLFVCPQKGCRAEIEVQNN